MNRAALPIRVDRHSPVPLYFQVAQHLEQLIESGELPMGTRLDNEAHLARQLGLPEVSMGMTDDLEVALSEGSTMVRVGRALFGERPLRPA